MKYTKFTISNFKGIKHLEIHLDKIPQSNIFSLVGLNESGKTTILEAIHWFGTPEVYKELDLIPKNELFNFNKTIEVKAEIELNQKDVDAIFQFLKTKHKFILKAINNPLILTRRADYKGSSKTTEKILLESVISGHSTRSTIIKQLSSSDLIVESLVTNYIVQNISRIFYYPNFLFDFPEKIYLEKLNNPEVIPNFDTYKEIIQDILNSIDSKLNIQDHIMKRAKGGTSTDKAALASLLMKMASKIETQVINDWRELLKIDQSSIGVSTGSTIEMDEIGYYLQINISEGDQLYHIRERSLGFRWFFAFVLFIYFRTYRYKDDKNILFLLDEPASNLHPSGQGKLLDAFKVLGEKHTVIYSTHSHHMIRPEWLTGTYVVKNSAKEYEDIDIKYNSRMTDITAQRYFVYASRYPNDKDFFRPILDALDYQPSQLELVPDLVIVEGKNDYYTLRYYTEVCSEQTINNIHVYPSTGKDKTDYTISLYLSWGRKFVVILDGDTGGVETKKRLLEKYGPCLNNRVLCLSDIDKTWSKYELEDLFGEVDKKRIIKKVFSSSEIYEKSKLNSAIQQLFIQQNQIILSSTSNNRFQKLLSSILTVLNQIPDAFVD